MSSEIVIAKIDERDIKEIVQIGLSTPELQLKQEDPSYYSAEMLTSFIKSPHDIYLVAKIENKIAGYRLATFNPYLKEAYLIDLVVKPEYRSQGVASKLYEKTFEILNKVDCHRVWALVKEGNTKIIEVLTKKDFVEGNKFITYFKTAPF